MMFLEMYVNLFWTIILPFGPWIGVIPVEAHVRLPSGTESSHRLATSGSSDAAVICERSPGITTVNQARQSAIGK